MEFLHAPAIEQADKYIYRDSMNDDECVLEERIGAAAI
jgi:hypothetical protein